MGMRRRLNRWYSSGRTYGLGIRLRQKPSSGSESSNRLVEFSSGLYDCLKLLAKWGEQFSSFSLRKELFYFFF